MFEKEGEDGGGRLSDWVGAFKSQLAAAQADLEADKPETAEKRARALVCVLKAVRETAEFEAYVRATAPNEDVEALRAEIRSRYARIVEGGSSGAVS